MAERGLCLVTGASGYIGGRLVPELLAAGYPVRCMARNPDRLAGRPWRDEVETARADAFDPRAVRRALSGASTAYYLIHSLGGRGSFEERDRAAARIFADAARAAGLRRIVYLGGIAPAGAGGLSPHLRSRSEVGELLLASGVPTAVLQAAVIIGSGSASFEMLRYLTERLPVMVTPTWVRTLIQPVAVRDVLYYLTACAGLPPEVSRRFDIGGPDIVTYADMMRRYAAVAGLPRRLIVPVPVLTPQLSSLWVGLVTPVPGGLARPLVESLRNEVVCGEHDIAGWIADPPGGLTPLDEAIGLALRRASRPAGPLPGGSRAGDSRPGDSRPGDSLPGDALAREALAGDALASDALPGDPAWAGGSVYADERSAVVAASPGALWQVIEGIGGDSGWYSLPAAWALRGLLDRLAGGAGLRRGRRDPAHLREGDVVDFWRAESIEPGSRLRLRAEMKLPGEAWLELSAEQDRAGRTVYRQRAVFRPHGLAGQVYWWSLRPFHDLIFGAMLRNIAATASRGAPGPAGARRRTAAAR
ncbi:MAG: SDR family oxidoreductase [Gemmatimonadota bacterium]